jgi:hypothetical protein
MHHSLVVRRRGRRIRDSNLPANGRIFRPRYAPGSAPHALGRAHSTRKSPATLQLIDTLPSDPFVRFLEGAPIDDEPVSAEEEAAVAEVEADRAAGVPTVSFEEVKRNVSGEVV